MYNTTQFKFLNILTKNLPQALFFPIEKQRQKYRFSSNFRKKKSIVQTKKKLQNWKKSEILYLSKNIREKKEKNERTVCRILLTELESDILQADPKSASLMCPVLSIKTFSGITSLQKIKQSAVL